MLDIVTSGDNLQEKIKALLIGKIWKMFRYVPPYFYVLVT